LVKKNFLEKKYKERTVPKPKIYSKQRKGWVGSPKLRIETRLKKSQKTKRGAKSDGE